MTTNGTHSDSATTAWRWPTQAPILGTGLRGASFIEWRYYAVLAPSFHGMVGLALVNPRGQAALVAESGLLVIVAGVFGDDAQSQRAAADAPAADATAEPAALCWMHLFRTADCDFDAPGPGGLLAEDTGCCIELRHSGPCDAEIRIQSGDALALALRHRGVSGTACAPVADDLLDRGPAGLFSGKLLGSRWLVDCPAPVATTDGEIEIDAGLLMALATGPGDTPSYATPALRERAASGAGRWTWQQASGYYEHCYGLRPLPLHGWDFLFVPDVERQQAAVLQTYLGSRSLRYLDVCWQQNGAQQQHRFGADTLHLEWTESMNDPVLGTRRPLVRRIRAEADGLRLELQNRVLHRLPLLRRHKLAVRHFFISEEIGIADWTLSDGRGEVLAAARGQPCGGELAHFRWRVPVPR